MPQPIELPNGVKLRDPEDFDTLRSTIFDNAKNRIIKSFPHSYNNMRLELHDVDYSDPDHYTTDQQKEAIMKDKFLSRRLKGTLRLFDETTNSLVDEKPMTLMRVPYLTERGTFIYNGNEYAHVNQARMMYGAYTRRQNNGDLETQFQVKSGTGPSFRVGFEPENAQYRLKVGNSKLHLYSLFSDLGVPEKQLESMWGSAVLEKNKNKYDARVFEKAYQNLVPKKEQVADSAREIKVQQIHGALDKVLLHEESVKNTLPGLLSEKHAAAWRLEKEAKIKETDKIPFKPDLSPADLQDDYNALYGKHGPQLAGMKEWPDRWFAEGSNQLGWLDWYFNYFAGERSFDDERQIMRWKLFKARSGAKFVKNPTPKAGYSLRLWGIDPLRLISDLDKRRELHEAMQAFKDKETAKSVHHNPETQVKMAASEIPLPEIIYQSEPLQELEWITGLISHIKSSSNNQHKHIVAVLDPLDLMAAMSDLNVKMGSCHAVHLSNPMQMRIPIATGIPLDVPNELIQEAINLVGNRIGPAIVHASNLSNGCQDMHLDSPDLEDMHEGLKELFKNLIKSDTERFSPVLKLTGTDGVDEFEYPNPPHMKVIELRLVEPEAETILIEYV